jgi:hypothetical protein
MNIRLGTGIRLSEFIHKYAIAVIASPAPRIRTPVAVENASVVDG